MATRLETTSSAPPPVLRTGVWGWMRQNLFATPLDTIITAVVVAFLLWTVPPLLSWAIFDATIAGETKEACAAVQGACWTIVKVRFDQLIYGLYPASERWRVNLTFVLFVATLVPFFIKSFRHKGIYGLVLLLVFPWIATWILEGSRLRLPPVETPAWGGLFLTLVIAIVGIVMSLPIGIVLALGRRSDMPIIKAMCVALIELVRGVPLVTVLFMASVMLPLFFPKEITIDKLMRALIGVSIFAGAYMAEVIRGGLQAIPKGQYEAANALGLSYWKSMYLIILPQALRLVIPGIMNSFIALFKDTSLVTIMGLYDLLGISRAIVADPQWLGLAAEMYVAAGFGFWIFCFAMSRFSQNLEQRLHTGHKR